MDRPWQRNYRSQNSRERNWEEETYFSFSSQNNSRRMSNPSQTSDNFPQNRNYGQEAHNWRSFCEGRESASASDHETGRSLNEQRYYANQQHRQRGSQQSRNNRNRSRGKRNNNSVRVRSRGYASDNESVSSSGSQRQYDNRNSNFSSGLEKHFSPHQNTSGISVGENFHGPKNVSNSSNYDKFYEKEIKSKFEFRNMAANTGPKFGNEGASSLNLLHDPEPKDTKIPTKFHENVLGNASTQKGSYSTCGNDKLTELRSHQKNYESILKSLNPMDIILDCRQQVDEMTKDCTAENMKKIQKLSAGLSNQNKCDVLKLHLNNLVQQQEQFDSHIAKIKGQLSSMVTFDVKDLLNKTELIKENVQKECQLFKRALPAYAYKCSIINKVNDNQVTIIPADSPYFLNILLPVFLKEDFPSHHVVCCETSELLKASLKRNIFDLARKEDETEVSNEQKLNSYINVMSEKELLNLLLNDYTFDAKNILIILNLSLKRSVDLDIVLANLRDILVEKEQSKLVLAVSIYDHKEKYEKYFSAAKGVGAINVPNITIPVRTVWKSSPLLPNDDYVEDVVKTAIAIHVLNKAGDIVAFLPTLADAKSACANLNRRLSDLHLDDMECTILHENSPAKSSLDLFCKKRSSKRTLFLVTDCAEMLIIPSVCFIIDSGLRKENMFDSSKKLDVLITTFISRDKAKLRKSLAGTFNAGICYRLYNKDNYKEMPSKEYPEMLTVNPFNSLIKIFQHRQSSALEVDFVECLPESTKENALKLLKRCNAIKDNQLTVLGRDMVKLPFPAKYSKLILLGIQWGLAYEAVTLVSFFSVKGRVFQFFNDPDQQRDTDAVKLQLIQGNSDTLSYLYIYKKWLENDRDDMWCRKHHINCETLKTVHSKVNEICRIVGENLKENIIQETKDIKSFNTTSLLEMLFDCFQDDLCVFTGHYKSGYRVLSSHCIAFLHPSSIICEMENLPQFIIFDHMVSTSRDFLVSITSIPDDFVMKALTGQTIEFDYSDMFEKSLVQEVIEPVGERMIKQVLLGKKGGKLGAIEGHIKELLHTDSLVIEPVAEKGRVLVYALAAQVDEAVALVKDVLQRQFDELINLEQTQVLELKKGHVKIPVELKWIKGAKVSSLKIGKCEQKSVTIHNNLSAVENLLDQLPCVIQQSINLTWTRRACNGKGFVNFKSSDFVHARKLAMKYITFLGTKVFVQLSRNATNQLFITEIPPSAKNCELEDAFARLLPPGIAPEKVELKYVPPFETSQNELQEIKEKIVESCQKYTKLADFNVVIPSPKNTATIMKAYLNVGDEDIEEASERLSKCTVGGIMFISKPVYRSVIKCNVKVCEALKPRFLSTLKTFQMELAKKFSDKALFEFDIDGVGDDTAIIKMLTNNREILQTLQRTVNELLEGEVINKDFSPKLNKIFCHGGHMWLRTLEKTTGNVKISEDFLNKSLRLYGSEESCRYCKQRILQFLADTENEAVTCISLSGKTNNRKLLKALIMKYGVHLENFIESCKLQSAVLDIKSCSLSLHGGRDSIEEAENTLKELVANLDENNSEVFSSEDLCPVCSSPALNLTFRLELCGHLYCSECIQGLVEQAQFPIQCCADDCFKDIIHDDICKILEDDQDRIKSLLEKSMKDYIQAHKQEIFYCPAPDCSMFFYNKDISDDKLNCPLCQNDICINCNVVYHQGLACDMYQGSKSDPDYSFKIWSKTSTECKQCPKCKSAIEKTGGCDHMSCNYCHSHFCWRCKKEFPNDNSIYQHLPYCLA